MELPRGHPPMAAADRLRAPVDRPRRVPGRASARLSDVRELRGDRLRRRHAASEKLDAFVRATERVLDGCGGSVLSLTLGDKGAYLYGVSARRSRTRTMRHERARPRSRCARSKQTTAARDIQVGISYGRLRSGTYGHARRRTFGCLGDAVNLAARLMSAAPAGAAFVTAEVARAAGPRFSFEALPDFKAKGKSQLVPIRRLTGRTRGRLSPREASGAPPGRARGRARTAPRARRPRLWRGGARSSPSRRRPGWASPGSPTSC